MTKIGAFQQGKQKEVLAKIPPPQKDWFQYRKNRLVRWQPKRFELGYVGSFDYSFDQNRDAIGSFKPEQPMPQHRFPRIVRIDESLINLLESRRIVWTPNHRAHGNVDCTEWKAIALWVRRTNLRDQLFQFCFQYANHAVFNTFKMTSNIGRVKLYIAKAAQDIYRSGPFEGKGSREHCFRKSTALKPLGWRRCVERSKQEKCQIEAQTRRRVLDAIAQRLLTPDELHQFINGHLPCGQVLQIIDARQH